MGNGPGVLSARRGVTMPELSSDASTTGTSLRTRCNPTAVTRTTPAASTMLARVAATVRPRRATSATTKNPAIGTGLARSTVMRVRRTSGRARSIARASNPVGGPAWHASTSHGPRA